jgi:uncharacterized protein YaaQ
MMKMMLAVMPTHLSEEVSKSLVEADYRVTKFANSPGFLTEGTTTLLVVAPSESIPTCLELIRNIVAPHHRPDPDRFRVTIFVLKVKDFSRV